MRIDVDLPSDYKPTLAAACRDAIPTDDPIVPSLSDNGVLAYVVKDYLRVLVRRYALRHADTGAVLKAEIAAADAERLRADAQASRRIAEAQALDAVDKVFDAAP